MGKLKGAIFYCAGPMDESPDGGVSWRKEITPRLHKMGCGVFDPANKPTDEGLPEEEMRALHRKYKEEERWEQVAEVVKPVVGRDLRMCHLSQAIILFIDRDLFMCGSFVECTWGVQQRKPILVVCKQGKKMIPGFLWGMIPEEMFFNNFDEMFSYLERIDRGEKTNDKRRWCLFDMDKVYGRN